MEKSVDNLLKGKVAPLIANSLLKQIFTGCSIGFFRRVESVTEISICNYGLCGHSDGDLEVDSSTLFDLASLTKPLVTSLSLLVLIEEGLLCLEDSLESFFDISIGGYEFIKIHHLLSHSSGLPAHKPYYKELLNIPAKERKKKLVQLILCEKLCSEPGSKHLYSDLGFMLLGEIVEQVSGLPLDIFWRQNIIEPLSLDRDLYFPPIHTNAEQQDAKSKGRRYVATGVCPTSGKKLVGQVHDDNCRSLGGVAGHAGLFGTSKALLGLMERLSAQYSGREEHLSYSSEILRKLLLNKQGGWRFGFDTPSAGLSSSGHCFSEMTIGHLGFTGTSFWLDLQQQIGIVFLTNRVISSEDIVEIKRLRPLIHDLIMESLIKNPTE